jgi:hypothetical protein
MASKPPVCWMCGKIVDLNTCKIDESGLPVHEQCYVARTILRSNRSESPSPDNELSE